MTPTLPAKSPPRKCRWAVARGGNRLSRLRQILVAEERRVAALAVGDPRRRPTMPRLRWLLEPATGSIVLEAERVP